MLKQHERKGHDKGGVSTAVEFLSGGNPLSNEAGLTRRDEMTVGTILLIVLILVLLGVIPTWPHSRGWGYGPSGILGAVLVVLIVLLLMGRL